MGVGETKGRVIHLDGFTLHLERRALYRGPEHVHLTSKPFETLVFLVENHGRVVEKQELLDAVWKDTFVTESTLVQAIREIRRVLDDNKEDPHFIQTVPRQGYRFVGEVFSEHHAGEITAAGPLLPITASGRRPKWKLLAVAAAIIVASIPVTIWLLKPDPPKTEKKPRPAPKLIPTGVVSANKPVLSPDGKVLLFVSYQPEWPGELDLYIKDAAGDSGYWITQRANASGDLPVFTPDGSQIVFSRYRSGDEGDRLPDLWIIPSSGGGLSRFITEASGAGFSPDGRYVAYTKQLGSTKPLLISPRDDLSVQREVAGYGFMPRWSRDGKWIAYTTSNPNGGEGDLWVVDTASLSERRNLTNKPQQMYGLTWTSDGRSMIFASNSGGPFQLWRAPISGGPVELFYSDLDDLLAPHCSADGTLVFAKGRPVRNLIRSEGVESATSRRMTEDEYHYWPRLSPSGRHLASIIRRRETEESLHVYVTDLETGKRVRLKDHPVHHPCWIDDENIAYLQETASRETEVRREHFPSGTTLPITRFPGQAGWLAFHPGKKRLAVVLQSPDGSQHVMLRDLEKSPDLTIAEGAEYEHLRWLPDGESLSWSGPEKSADPGSNGVWVVKPGEAGQRLIPDGYAPVWSADGATIYFSRIGGYSGLWRFDVRRRTQARVRDWKRVPYHDIAGERLVFTQDDNRSQIYSMALSQ